jgi:tetratricopeptide (TPR) repeat protein
MFANWPQALYYAGIFLLHADRVEKAREYVDRLLKINPQSKDGLILKGWLEVNPPQVLGDMYTYSVRLA